MAARKSAPAGAPRATLGERVVALPARLAAALFGRGGPPTAARVASVSAVDAFLAGRDGCDGGAAGADAEEGDGGAGGGLASGDRGPSTAACMVKSRLASTLSSRVALMDEATPATPWDVDADFITRALREAELLPDGVDVAAISIEPLSLQGFISDVARCRVTYSSRDAGGATPMPGEGTGSLGTLPPSLIVKTCASNDESYAAGRECDAYKTEAVFFKNLARVVSVGSPECLLVSSDGPGERYCYVMEDLDLRPDIYYVPQSLGAGEKECRAVAKGLAELHAPRWRWERPLPAWLPAMTEHPLRNPARVFSEWWESFSSSTYFTELPEPSRLAHERCQRRAEQLAAALSSGPRTLLHCDARSDNLFFGDRTAPGGVVFLDWQLICQGIGVFDLAWFMCTSAVHGTPGEERDRPIVEAYWEALTSHPSGRVSKARYTLEAAWRDYQLGAATTMAVFSCAPKFLSDAIRSEKPKEYEQLAEMIGRSAAVVAAIGADTVPYERLVH